MAENLLIIDKDGTLTKTASGERFVQNPADQVLIGGVADALEAYRSEGWEIVIATNQGGVEAGHKSLRKAIDETIYAMRLTSIDYAMIAPSFEKGEIGDYVEVWLNKETGEYLFDGGLSEVQKYRKPAPGMLLHAMQSLDAIAKTSLYVGDRTEDKEAAQAAGVPFQWAKDWRGDTAYEGV